MILQETDPKVFEEIFPVAGQNSLQPIYNLFLDNNQHDFILSQRPSDSSFLLADKKSGKFNIPNTIFMSPHPQSISTRNLLFFPDWSYSNPYQSLFYENLQKIEEFSDLNIVGIGINQVNNRNLLQLVGQVGLFTSIGFIHSF